MFRTCYVVAEDNKLYCVDVKLYCVTQIDERLNFKFSIGCEHASAGLWIAIFVVYFLYCIFSYTRYIHSCYIVNISGYYCDKYVHPFHKSPVVRGLTPRTTDGNLLVRAALYSIKCYSPFLGCDPEGSTFNLH